MPLEEQDQKNHSDGGSRDIAPGHVIEVGEIGDADRNGLAIDAGGGGQGEQEGSVAVSVR